jgi:hypothetical protein
MTSRASEITSPQYFGPYNLRFTTEADVEDILEHIAAKEKVFSQQTTKREAVYRRQEDFVAEQVRRGRFTAIDRIAGNEEEFERMGREKRLVAITGAYPLGIDEHNHNKQQRIPIEARAGQRAVPRITWEVGTSLYLKPLDVPNKAGLYPLGGFYDLLVVSRVLDLFARAEDDTVDAITANVQTRLTSILARLTQAPNLWTIIGSPSPELISATSGTTQGEKTEGQDRNFEQQDKYFLTAKPNNFPAMAAFLLKAYRNGGSVVYERGGIKNIVRVRLDELPRDLLAMLPVIVDRYAFFNQNAQTGISETRIKFNQILPLEIEPPSSTRKSSNGWHGPASTFARRPVTDDDGDAHRNLVLASVTPTEEPSAPVPVAASPAESRYGYRT